MKKLLTITMTLLMLLGTPNITALAETKPESADVYITISDSNGALALAQEKITVTDVDNDGALTINDALYAAHEAKYEGGAAAGYASEQTQYGLSLSKLWGTVNGGSYGYYLNNQSAWSLTDAIKNGDYINAFVYTDLTAWSDTYCYFNVNTAAAESGNSVTLTLSASGYDSDWNPVTVAVSNAVITVNGAATEIKTDSEGKALIRLENAGTYVISAVSNTQTLVPPVCKVTVSAATQAPLEPNTEVPSESNAETPSENSAESALESDIDTISEADKIPANYSLTTPQTGDNFNIYLFVILAVVALAVIVVILCMKKKNNEK